MSAMTGGGKSGEWSCVRYPGQHTLEIVVISKDCLRERLGRNKGWLHPGFRRKIKRKTRCFPSPALC